MPEKNEGLTAEDLQKSLDRLDEYATSDDPAARKDALLAKANDGDLEKSERDELFDLLGGAPASTDTETASTVSEDLVKSMTDDGNQGLQEALDVSPYLREQHEALVKSLGAVGGHIEKSDKRQHEYNILHARALVDVGNLVKGMSERLGIIEKQPARGPKSRGVTPGETLAKSFAGEEGGDEQLSKSEIADALDGLMAESMEGGRNGLTKSGADILIEISKFEQLSKLSPDMFGEVKGFISRRSAAH